MTITNFTNQIKAASKTKNRGPERKLNSRQNNNYYLNNVKAKQTVLTYKSKLNQTNSQNSFQISQDDFFDD